MNNYLIFRKVILLVGLLTQTPIDLEFIYQWPNNNNNKAIYADPSTELFKYYWFIHIFFLAKK